MAFTTTCKLSELPLKSSLPLNTHSHSLSFLFSHPRLSFHILKPFASLKTAEPSGNNKNPNDSNRYSYPWDDDIDENTQNPKPTTKSKSSSAPWLTKWPSSASSVELSNQRVTGKVVDANGKDPSDQVETLYFDKDKGHNAIERIVLRLRNLGLASDDEVEEKAGNELEGREAMPLTGEEKLGDLLRREWVRPDMVLAEEKNDEMLLPWERGEDKYEVEEEGERGLRKRRVRAPTLAELTIEDEELRRLRRMGMQIRERISVPKAGLTQAVLEKIHDKWRKEELVRLKFHEVLARDMKTAHEIVEVCLFPGNRFSVPLCTIS